jgi:membrane protease YdiL (CAAX protease family)
MASLKTMAETRSSPVKILFSILFLLSFGIAEYLIYFVNDLGGLVLYFAILCTLIISSVITSDKNQAKLWLALGLIPLIRIISLIIPLPEISQVYWYLFSSIPIFIAIYAVMRVLSYSFSDIGLKGNYPILQSFVALLGLFLGAIGYFILRPEALTSGLNLQTALFPALILLISTGFVEEMAFRGVLQIAANVLGSWDWIYISIIYAVLQTGHGSYLFGLFVFLVSLFFGLVVKKTGSIVGVSLAHGLFNIGMYLIFPFVF